MCSSCVKEREAVAQLASASVVRVCECVCVCVLCSALASIVPLIRVVYLNINTLHSALCSHVCMRQSLCDLPVVHFTKDVRNVVVED